MKEYNERFTTKSNYDISVSTHKNTIELGIDIGIDGFFTELTTKETENLIAILKQALKKLKNKNRRYAICKKNL